jgi:hypothetical protein
MSAFLVEDKTINRVVTWLSGEITKNAYLKRKVEEALHIDTVSQGWEAILGHALFELNIVAVNERYGAEAAGKFRTLYYRYAPLPSSEIQVLKSLQCFLYQCTEGEGVKSPLYRFFDTVVKCELMEHIIYKLPAWESAAWG